MVARHEVVKWSDLAHPTIIISQVRKAMSMNRIRDHIEGYRRYRWKIYGVGRGWHTRQGRGKSYFS
jgi:hypothetical protein